MDDPDTPMLVASQASMSESPNLAADVNMIMLSMLQKMCRNMDCRKYFLKVFKSDKITLKVIRVSFQGFCEVSIAK